MNIKVAALTVSEKSINIVKMEFGIHTVSDRMRTCKRGWLVPVDDIRSL